MKHAFLVVLLLFSVSAFPQNGTKNVTHSAKPTPLKVVFNPRAGWDTAFQASYGIDASDYERLGLAKLTSDEREAVGSEAKNRWNQGYNIASKWITQLSCTVAEPGRKIRLYLEEGKNNPSEFSSEFRQKLRAIADVEIVYSEDNSDLSVSALVMADKSKSGMPMGYTASLVVSLPCKTTLGEKNWITNDVYDHFVLGDSDVHSIVDGVVARIDAKSIESKRKEQAYMKQIQGQK